MSPRSLALAAVVATCLCWPATGRWAHAQVREQGLADRCRVWHLDDPEVAAVLSALGLRDSREAAKALEGLEGPIRTSASASPDDVNAQYRLAVWLGARAEREGGRRKIAAAKEMYPLVQHLLDREPQHSGANYLMGRLHAGVMRMDRITRFLATHLLGGGVLKGASWEASQRFLEVAESNGPCDPEHHYELARLYGERQQRPAAERERRHVLELTAGSEGRWATIRDKAEKLPAVWARKER